MKTELDEWISVQKVEVKSCLTQTVHHIPQTEHLTCNRNSFLSSGGWKSQIKVPVCQKRVSSRLQTHKAEDERELSMVFFTMVLIPFRRGPPSRPSHLPKVLPPTPAPQGLEFQLVNFGNTQTRRPEQSFFETSM